MGGSDYGLQLTLRTGNDDKISSSWHYPVVLDCTGGNCYRDAISGCADGVVGPGTIEGSTGNHAATTGRLMTYPAEPSLTRRSETPDLRS